MASIPAAVFRQLVDDTYMNKIVDKLNRPPTCVVKRTTNFAMATGADNSTVITWQAEQGNDFDNMWDVLAPTVLTIKTEGLYVATAQIRADSTTSDQWYLDLLLNGSTSTASFASTIGYGANNGAAVQVTSPPTLMAVNDTLRLLVRHNNAGTKNLLTTRGGTWLAARWDGYGT